MKSSFWHHTYVHAYLLFTIILYTYILGFIRKGTQESRCHRSWKGWSNEVHWGMYMYICTYIPLIRLATWKWYGYVHTITHFTIVLKLWWAKYLTFSLKSAFDENFFWWKAWLLFINALQKYNGLHTSILIIIYSFQHFYNNRHSSSS